MADRVGQSIHLPPLSSSKNFKFRHSKSPLYDKTSPEWYWKLSPALPELWIRDSNLLTPAIIAELETAWLQYQSLNIPGKGDGARLSMKTRQGRRLLEIEYSRLDLSVRRAKEVALARYDNFVIRGTDGSLDYHTETVDTRTVIGKEEQSDSTRCIAM
ncbi:uncharacterized protein BP5553_01645 [Venustampulla echinocandica]|uniref:Uncharacterized protein n=1 Tax=Venustampulla echinocandica TaxID=2656787 RepID=A0A370U1K9_9HELO|nr:uncharacterized protein BP5553_01645 [Venustampulla echinocandica]RDL41666.1 hypothetical protein BP5553_01645 [Venustampulla echinocandica]